MYYFTVRKVYAAANAILSQSSFVLDISRRLMFNLFLRMHLRQSA